MSWSLVGHVGQSISEGPAPAFSILVYANGKQSRAQHMYSLSLEFLEEPVVAEEKKNKHALNNC